MRAVVLRDGRLKVRDTADPVPGPGQLLLRPLSAAIYASDGHYMDHPNSAPRFEWDSARDTIMGHDFIGKVIGLDEVPDAIESARKSQGPPRVVVHPTAS
jgi:threonine dehydrogenase-like Zn-dependent dehydrogenase